MTTTTHLLHRRRFLPLFITQFLGAFNDNLYKTAMVLFVVYSIYNSEAAEGKFSAIASLIFIIPFFAFSALAGQLADMRDKAKIIRIIKAAEIVIMLVGASGLIMAQRGIAVETIAIPILLLALFGMGVHSTFFGPIKYAILPQHLHKDEVLAGTGLVEAATYIAILTGTILAGWIAVDLAAALVVLVAVIGYIAGRQVPPAPPMQEPEPIDYHLLRSSIALVRKTMHDKRVFLAIMSISLFWAIGTVMFIHFPPLVKNNLASSKEVASMFLVVFSVGVAIGSLAVNALLKGKVSARYAPAAVLVMGAMVVVFYAIASAWPAAESEAIMGPGVFLGQPLAIPLLLSLVGIAISGGMFVVPLYAFLTTFVPKTETSRTIAANNIVNSGAMVAGAAVVTLMSAAGVPILQQLLLSAAMCLGSAWLAARLLAAEKAEAAKEASG